MTATTRFLAISWAVTIVAAPAVQMVAAPFQSVVAEYSQPATNSSASPLLYRIEAYAGKPFGVGTLRYRMCIGDDLIVQSGATLLTEKNNRVFYPVFSRPATAQFFQRFMGIPEGPPDSMHHVWFLFRGDEPLELTLQGACQAARTVEVEYTRTKKFDRILKQWWREFNAAAARQQNWGDYPPLIETYLTSMLSQRLSLTLPTERKNKKDPLARTLEMILDMESLRSQAIEDGMAGLADSGAANLPLPSGVFWDHPELNESEFRDVQLEPFADCIPEECFYLRFGSWGNQIWLRRLTEEFGGDLGRMVSLRGYQSKIQSKFLNQLAIESTEFDRLFGGNLIADVAVIGNDMFFEEGSAVGILLHAKNTKSLENNLSNKRRQFAETHANIGCTIEDVDVDGVRVPFLKTPDNRYRSFHVVQGDKHLITSSISLARRFIEASSGNRSLAQSLEFKYARQQMPLSRDDTVFIFMPSKLLHNLLGPHYQIEIARRNRSITDMQMVELAVLAAQNEGFDVSRLENLVDNGFLPEQFGRRPDGSQLSRIENFWVDSIRGRRGFFVPIPDVELAGVTQREIDDYALRRQFLTENLSQLDPMFIGLKRFQYDNNIERIAYDAHIAPFGQEKYGWLFSMLGEPLTEQVKGSPNDIISFQTSLQGGRLGQRIPAHQVFGAIQDEMVLSTELKPKTIFNTIDILRTAPGYIGSWPKAGYLDWLPKLGGQPDEFGFTYSRLLGLWRLQWEDYSAMAFDRERLMELQEHVHVVPTQRPAQIRIDIGDLANSNLRPWAIAQNYRRSWETSIANTRLLNMMSQQFNLAPAIAKETTEALLDVDLVCSLGGEYKLFEPSPSPNRLVWHSTAWPEFANPSLPDDYTSPLLKWFRGLQLELLMNERQFSVHGFLDIERSGSTTLPSFDMFKGFGNLLGGGQKSE